MELKKGNKKEFNLDINNRLNEIHNYYLNAANIIGYNVLDDKVFSNIDDIIFLKNFNNIFKTKYITIVEMIENEDRVLLDKIRAISDLTEVFLCLQDKVNEYDVKTLANIFAYKVMNKVDVEDAVSMLSSLNEGRKKM